MSKKAYIPANIRAHVEASSTHCVACGTWDADQCGHIIAESNGGQMVPENFIRLCGSCNAKQGTASAAFKSFATYSIEPAIILTRRAYWAKYCAAAKTGHAKPYNPK